MKISMQYLLQVIDDIRNKPDASELVDHILMHPDDFVSMMMEDHRSNNIDVINPGYRDDALMTYDAIIARSLCVFGVPIRTSEDVRSGNVFKVLKIV